MRTASLAQFNGVLLLALNRYTAIVLPTRHQNIWSKRVLVCAIFAQWIVPIAIITPYFWVGIVHSPIDNSTAVAVRFAYIHIHRFYYIVGTVYMGVICFSCTVLYAHMLYSQSVDTRHRTLSVASNTGGRTKRGSAQHLQPLMQARTLGIERYAARKQLELKLALSGFAVFLVALSYTIMMAYTSTSQNYHTVFILWTFSSDILSYANVYILFIVSPIVRQRFAQTVCGFFRRRKGNRSNLSSPRSSATARTLIFTKQTNLNVDDDFV
uniref:G-protein coupled receptors family 1 profile domain-containing protein n=1 Tax=Plectus sambesii TaxID=2011161 RepID=A0A914WJ42_9BILA